MSEPIITINKSGKGSLKTYLRMLRYLKGLIGAFSLSIIGFLVFAASQPMLAKTMELIIEAIEAKNDQARWTLPAFAVGVFLLRGIGMFMGTYFNDYVGATVIKKVRLEIFDKLMVLPASYYDGITQGQLLHRLSGGVSSIRGAITNALKTIVREGFTIVALLGYVFYLNWQLSLVFLGVAPILAYMVSYTSKTFRKIARKDEGAMGKAMQVSKETIGNYGVVRGFGAEVYEKRRYEGAINQAFKAQMKIRRIQAVFSPLSQVVISIAVSVIIFLLLDPTILAANTTGELVGYLTAVALIPKPLRQLSGVSVTIQRGIVGAELVFGVLDEAEETDQGTYVTEGVEGGIRVENLSFKYPSTEHNVLSNIGFHVEPGEMVAFVGKSGSGKSTLMSLLYRTYDVEAGKIFLDDVDVNDYRLSNLRQHIATVNQNIALFDDTIRNNVAYGDSEYSDEQVIAALKSAHAWEFVEGLPDGLDTIIGENGLKLSGGQRQRLSIARAFLKDAPILILDEATSSLDNESEAKITQAIEALAKTRTTLVIAHRLSTIMRADRLVVLNQGSIVEQGVHSDLIEKGGVYADLFHAEFE
ncbi:MAG: lipid A export permease/ATP-binding protein MsbA [Pseudomonadales bacterium]|nr:lipid A export permease/ATP-binding protein MsbA [Pseudomonadales bacterium]MEC8811533.1 lipid A export permease/ATP-binding protein MsbA [Pseudomonadota bacterium]HAG94680.1 lipid A export permease/ATP-binding protein MsbA [Gammaproteobacteria bacterium]MAQ26196.1 lipid A export permease/ATP-binding protein MsbA [Pseudomonadales bacterium]HAU13099.1 lipid A export permease/ATP-binding protein MsbA [Gammaproteobacteria bacterium]|tara:strand:+ start:8653 stop:10410 length:1758 start_codon:yes stop_codon:yes gene_type:complete